jgi:transcriptional regulator with XRE-family HTH domain
MKLNDWLKREGLTPTDLAKRMKRPQATIARYASGQRIPEPPIMKEIFEVTAGEVTPNDFYDCAETATEPQAEAAQ